MEKKKLIIILVIIAVCCCSSSSGLFATYMGMFTAIMNAFSGGATVAPSTSSTRKGATSKTCWPDQTVDASCPTGCKKAGKCAGARTTVWDGTQWKACSWSGSGDNFDCSRTCSTGVNC